MFRKVEIQYPTIPCIDMDIELLKVGISSLNSPSFFIKSFVLILCKTIFPPSPIILNSSKKFPKQTFDLELSFRSQLSQSEN